MRGHTVSVRGNRAYKKIIFKIEIMKILKTAVVVELDDNKVYQVCLNDKQISAIHDLITLTSKNNSVNVLDEPISTITLA